MRLLLMISLFRFSLLDWVVLAIFTYSIVISVMKGFLREVMGLITVLTGVILAAWLYRRVGTLFKDVVRTENIALFFGFSLIFLGTLLVGFVTILLVTRFVKFAKLQCDCVPFCG